MQGAAKKKTLKYLSGVEPSWGWSCYELARGKSWPFYRKLKACWWRKTHDFQYVRNAERQGWHVQNTEACKIILQYHSKQKLTE